MKNECAEIDISEQIDNPWSKDTALAIKLGRTWFAVKIKAKDKNYLKKIFHKTGTKKDRKIRKQNSYSIQDGQSRDSDSAGAGRRGKGNTSKSSGWFRTARQH